MKALRGSVDVCESSKKDKRGRLGGFSAVGIEESFGLFGKTRSGVRKG